MKVLPPFIKDFLQETLNRLFMHKPKYFLYWQIVSYVGMAVCGIPYLLQQFPDLILPDWMQWLSSKLISAFSFAMFVMSQLTVNAPTVGTTTEGTSIKVIDETKMPFTAKAEEKKVEGSVPPPPTIEEVPEAGNDVPGSGSAEGSAVE